MQINSHNEFQQGLNMPCDKVGSVSLTKCILLLDIFHNFTHKHKYKKNIELIKKANENGFTINLSANNLEHADELAKHNLPVAVIVDEHTTATPDGRPVAMCLSQTKGLTCKQCKLCSVNTRKTIVGFLKH